MNAMWSLKGQYLVASQHLKDPNFARTVVLVLEHHEEGAAGVILNRPSGTTVADVSESVFEEAIDWDKPIRIGGPVPGPLMAIHELDHFSDQEIFEGIHSTVQPEKLIELIRDRVEPSVLIANYAGWGPGQLEMELGEDAWLFKAADARRTLQPGDLDMWKDVIHEIRGSQLSSMLDIDAFPEDPEVN